MCNFQVSIVYEFSGMLCALEYLCVESSPKKQNSTLRLKTRNRKIKDFYIDRDFYL